MGVLLQSFLEKCRSEKTDARHRLQDDRTIGDLKPGFFRTTERMLEENSGLGKSIISTDGR